MFSKEKTKTVYLRLAGISLGVLLVAAGGTLGPRPSPHVPPTGMALAATPAPDGTCQVVGDAIEKSLTMPYRSSYTHTARDGKTRTGETIYVNGAMYSLVNGKWFSFPESSGDMKGGMEAGRKNIKNASCHVLRDESVNGESATVYSVHDETDLAIHDQQVWISKSKGVLLRRPRRWLRRRRRRRTALVKLCSMQSRRPLPCHVVLLIRTPHLTAKPGPLKRFM